MFTGLVEGKGRVREIVRVRGEMRLTILPLFEMIDCRIGESISVNGVCLTVAGLKQGAFRTDVSGETLSRSTLSGLKPDEEVNLERALRMSDRLGGHLVAGHVDGIGRIVRKEQVGGSWRLEIGIEPSVARYTIEKGSVAVDGISLTINRCHEKGFEVNIIPQTWGETTILNKRVGDLVNIETDLIGKYVEKFLREPGSRGAGREAGTSPLDRDFLNKHGFGD